MFNLTQNLKLSRDEFMAYFRQAEVQTILFTTILSDDFNSFHAIVRRADKFVGILAADTVYPSGERLVDVVRYDEWDDPRDAFADYFAGVLIDNLDAHITPLDQDQLGTCRETCQRTIARL